MTTMTADETEVRRAKRTWPAQYKLDILTEIDQAKATVSRAPWARSAGGRACTRS